MDASTGGSGNDSFNAVIQGAGATGTTVAPGDVINGGAGTDTLSIAVAGALATNTPYTLAAVQTNGIEKLLVSNFETTTGGTPEEVNIIDGALMTGLTTVGLSASSATGDTSFTNLKNVVDVEMANGSADLTVGYASTAGDQTQNIALSNVSAGTLTIAGVENLNIDSGILKSTLTALTASAMESITVTGSTDLKITGALDFANATSATAVDGTIDASDFTGKLNITLGGTGDIVDITGGSAADTIDMAGTLTSSDAIDGGEGSDTLKMDAATLTTQFAKVSNIENVSINAPTAGTAVAIDASKLSAGVEKLTLDLSDNDDAALAASTVTKADGLLINVARSAADAADTGDNDGVSLTITDTTDSTDDTLNLQLTNVGVKATDLDGIELLDASTYETINITANTNALGTASANQIVGLTATVATNINVNGTGAFTTALTGTKVTSFDASDLAGALTLTAGSEKATYSMGGKSSTIAFGGNLNASDTVIGGAGALDTVTATVSGLTATTGALNLTDVEYALLTTSAANTIALAGTSGLANLGVTDNKQTITGLDLATTTVHLGLTADAAATSSEIDVTAADATGTDDTLKVIVNTTAGAADSIIDASDIENLSLTVGRATTGTNGTVTLDMTTFTGTGITVGTAALAAGATVTDGVINLGTLHKNTTSLVSTNKAAVTASMTNATTAVTFEGNGTGVQTITGGLRGDTFTIGSTTGAVAHSITGGSGTDTTNLTAGVALADVSGINTENVNITVPASVDTTITGDFNAGVDAITISGGNSLSEFDAGTLDAAIKSIDASDFLGELVVDVADSSLDSTLSITAGELTTDEVTAKLVTATTYAPVTTGVEILDLDINDDITVSLAGTTGVSRVEIDIAAGKDATIASLAGETIRVTDVADTNATIVAVPVDATETDNAVTFQLVDTGLAGGGAATIASGAKLVTSNVESVNIVSATPNAVDLSGLTMTTATDTLTLNLLATSALQGITLTSTSAQTTTINAAGAYGVTQTGRSATTAVDYTGSAGNDTFIMMATGDKIAGGAGTGDTLDVNYAAVLGGISVDLSASGEQISTLDGGAISGSVTGFENVDLSGYTGAGASVTAIKTGSTITGTGSTDRITGGAGNDTVRIVTATSADADVVVGGAGSDTIFVVDGLAGTTTAQNVIDLTTPGNGLIANVGAFANYSGFENIDVSSEAGATDGFTLKGDANANNIKGSAGDDAYTVTAGNDVVDLGAAADAISVTTALLAANSGTTATISGGAGTDTMTIADAGTTVVDADFRGISLVEALVLANGTNTIVLGATAKASGIVSLTGGTGADTVTLHDGITAYGITAGADVITLPASYASGLTMTDGVTATTDQRVKFDAFQDTATTWGAAEANAADVTGADKWHYAGGTLTIWNENLATPAAVEIAIVGAAVVADGVNAGSLTLDVA